MKSQIEISLSRDDEATLLRGATLSYPLPMDVAFVWIGSVRYPVSVVSQWPGREGGKQVLFVNLKLGKAE